MRIDWTALPEAVTRRVTHHAGGTHITPATTGDHAEIAATVAGTAGKVFVKAAHSDFGVRSLRFELRVTGPRVEADMLAPWLIGAGHTPEQADHRLARHPAWRMADPEVLRCFAARNAEKWASRSAQATVPWIHHLADWTTRWARAGPPRSAATGS